MWLRLAISLQMRSSAVAGSECLSTSCDLLLVIAGDSGVSSPGPSSDASLSSQKNSDLLSYMDRVVMEVIESESVYVRDLQQVVEVSYGHRRPSGS